MAKIDDDSKRIDIYVITITSRGIQTYATVLAKKNEFGEIVQIGALRSTKLSRLKAFGSTTAEFTLANILNSSAQWASKPWGESPWEITHSRKFSWREAKWPAA
jgi:hypothetical protein